MEQYIFVFVIYMYEFLISFYFFNNISKGYKKPFFKIWTGLLLYITIMVLYITLSQPWLNFFAFFVANTIYGIWAFQIKFKQSIFLSLVLDLICTLSEFFVAFLFSALIGNRVVSDASEPYLYLINSVICKTIYLLLVLFLLKMVTKKESKIHIPISFYLYPITVMVVLIVFWHLYTSYGFNQFDKIIISTISILLNLSVIVLFWSYQKNIEKDIHLINLQAELKKLENEKNYYDILNEQNEQLSIFVHDIKKHLSAISALSTNKEIDSYISIMEDELNQPTKLSNSGNHFLDTLIHRYITECNIKKIEFEFDIRLSNLCNISEYDLISILGNAFDNAVEAANNSENKYIKFYTDYKNNYDVITITNSRDAPPIEKNNILLTSKANKNLHGFGTKSLKKALKKYNGNYKWEYTPDTKEFKLLIVVPRN